MQLTIDASQADILKYLNDFKVHALNYAMNTMTDKNAVHLEPREVKSLVDIVLSLEDSIKIDDTEGKQARTIKRLLDRYTSGSEEDSIVHKSSGITVGSLESASIPYTLESTNEQ